MIGFRRIDICPFKYSSSLSSDGKPPGEDISILFSYILTLIDAFTSHARCTKAFAIASRKAFSGILSTSFRSFPSIFSY